MNRKLFSVLILVFASIIILTSCGNTNSSGKNLISMFGLVDGSNWRSAEPTAIVSDTKIKLNGTSANGQTIIITLNNAELGEYTFSETNGHYAEYIPNMASGSQRFSTLNNGNGYVKLSSLNEEAKTIGGEFYFVAKKADGTSKTITNGKFTNVPYTYYEMGEEAYTNIFKFTSNAREWNAKEISATKTDTAMLIVGECDRAEAWQSVSLQVPNDITAGIHYFGDEVKGYFQSGFYTFPATAGAITITENNSQNKIIKGTFFFNYLDNNNIVQSITDGSFDIKFTDLTVVE